MRPPRCVLSKPEGEFRGPPDITKGPAGRAASAHQLQALAPTALREADAHYGIEGVDRGARRRNKKQGRAVLVTNKSETSLPGLGRGDLFPFAPEEDFPGSSPIFSQPRPVKRRHPRLGQGPTALDNGGSSRRHSETRTKSASRRQEANLAARKKRSRVEKKSGAAPPKREKDACHRKFPTPLRGNIGFNCDRQGNTPISARRRSS